MNTYADIIHETRPESNHPKMRREDRAKIFAPFAALSGHEKAVHARDQVLMPRILLSGCAQAQLDRRLQRLQKGDTVSVTYFVSRRRTEGEELGEYVTVADAVVRLDTCERLLYLQSRVVSLNDLADVRRKECGRDSA